MRKIASITLAMTMTATVMTGCGSKANQVVDHEGKLQVYTSFYPLYDFATKVGGDKVNF